jgi:hypothetical protein
MTDKIPIPCEHCAATGIVRGIACEECRGKGYRVTLAGRLVAAPRPQRYRGQRTS